MTLLLKQIFGFLKLLNSDTGTNQLAAGVAAGFVLGMTPAFSLQTITIILLILFFRIQVGAALLGAFFFAFPAYLLDPVFNSVGSSLLESEGLKSLWTSLYNMPIIPYTRFYNSLVMGSGVVAFALSPFVFIGSKILIQKYRVVVVERFKETKFWKAVKATALFKWYAKYDSLYSV
ncbi:MAG: TIGR03546 family protein [Halobacteriovorax sp.]|nr:TIGR03546 family protein [Halobacteriovorax sp.]|tara:strand:+ start:69258 stop:69785 length:528 start_codon:yes stop_codon:yes gene_type:complete